MKVNGLRIAAALLASVVAVYALAEERMEESSDSPAADEVADSAATATGAMWDLAVGLGCESKVHQDAYYDLASMTLEESISARKDAPPSQNERQAAWRLRDGFDRQREGIERINDAMLADRGKCRTEPTFALQKFNESATGLHEEE